MALHYFGTDGFRGRVNVSLTPLHAYAIGLFLGKWTKEHKEEQKKAILIGKDTRESSDLLESALASGVLSSGINVYSMGVTTTPSIAYSLLSNNFAFGIMISASHNPYFDNGIKIFGKGGKKLDDAFLEQIESFIDKVLDSRDSISVNKNKTKHIYDGKRLKEAYTDHLVSLASNDIKGIKIGLDLANGATHQLAKTIFKKLGLDVEIINASPDGRNINENSGSLHPEGLKKLVLEKKLDVGFAFDGDGDRCIAVDERGNIVNGDSILYLCASFLKENGHLKGDTIVTTIMANLGLDKALDELGISYLKTHVGDRYVYEEISKNGFVLGGEQCGHIIFADEFVTGDGIFTALKILEVMSVKKEPLSTLLKEMKSYPQTLINVEVKQKDEVMNDQTLFSLIKEKEKNLENNGRILVRPSGTEELIRVMVEASNDKVSKEVALEITNYIEKKFGA